FRLHILTAGSAIAPRLFDDIEKNANGIERGEHLPGEELDVIEIRRIEAETRPTPGTRIVRLPRRGHIRNAAILVPAGPFGMFTRGPIIPSHCEVHRRFDIV